MEKSNEIAALKERVTQLEQDLEIKALKERIAELERKKTTPGSWGIVGTFPNTIGSYGGVQNLDLSPRATWNEPRYIN